MDVQEYVEALAEEAGKLPAAERGRFWADQIAAAPEDNEGWREAGVTPAVLDNTHQSFALACIDEITDDPATATAFAEAARGWTGTEGAQLSPQLRATMAARTLNRWWHAQARDGRKVDLEAATTVVSWALDGLAPDDQVAAVWRALADKPVVQLDVMVPVIDELALRYRSVAEVVVPALQGPLDEGRRAAAERREQEAERQLRAAAEREWRDLLYRNPMQAFDHAAGAVGADSPIADAVASAATGDRPGSGVPSRRALEAAGYLVSEVRDGRREWLPERVAAYLEAASDARSADEDFGYTINAYIMQFEELPVVIAPSANEFWDRLWQLSARREVDAKRTAELYGTWRERRITVAQSQHRSDIAAASAEDPAFAPPPGTSAAVSVHGATIGYADVEELLDDMREYFVPTPGALAPLGEVSRGEILGGSLAAAYMDVINRGYDAANMNRLAEEIRAWAASPLQEYVDEEAEHGGTPYKYGPGLFSGHGIRVERSEDGVRLRLTGGGYGPDGTELARNFGAFAGRPIVYDGTIRLKCQFLPGPNVATDTPVLEPREMNRGGADRYLGSFDLPVPFAGYLRYIKAIVGGDERFTADLASALIQTGQAEPRTREPLNVTTAGVDVTVERYDTDLRFSERPIAAGAERVMSRQPAYSASDRDGASIYVPAIDLTMRISAPRALTSLADRLMVAQQTGALHPATGTPDIGYLGGYGTFKFNDSLTASLIARAGEARVAAQRGAEGLTLASSPAALDCPDGPAATIPPTTRQAAGPGRRPGNPPWPPARSAPGR